MQNGFAQYSGIKGLLTKYGLAEHMTQKDYESYIRDLLEILEL